jgi:hypothetical protein
MGRTGIRGGGSAEILGSQLGDGGIEGTYPLLAARPGLVFGTTSVPAQSVRSE